MTYLKLGIGGSVLIFLGIIALVSVAIAQGFVTTAWFYGTSVLALILAVTRFWKSIRGFLGIFVRVATALWSWLTIDPRNVFIRFLMLLVAIAVLAAFIGAFLISAWLAAALGVALLGLGIAGSALWFRFGPDGPRAWQSGGTFARP